MLAAVPALRGQAPERTLFKDLPSTDSRREVIRAVLGSPFYSMRSRFPGREWTEGGYGGVWERARRYFPDNAYFVRPGTYFMTHGFGADGRLFMEVHDSAYLSLCVENRRTFTAGSIVGEYGRMRGAADGREAAAFREKVGRLESYFRDEPANTSLRKTLGEALYGRLLEELREENYHMLGGGLMHEGMHAGMDGEKLVARIQAEFKEGGLAVQWDELRAFMAEAGFHGWYCRWAPDEIAAVWGQAETRLKALETLRRKPRLVRGPDKAKFEGAALKIGASTALLRLRMRELWQSAQRMQGLMASFRKDYLKPDPPPEVDGPLRKLAGSVDGYVDGTGEAIRRTESALRRLEELLDQWDEWAAGRRPFPPPVTDSNDVLRMAKTAKWPDPPGDEATALMKKAKDEIAKYSLDKPLSG